jgi:hypothetical protein
MDFIIAIGRALSTKALCFEKFLIKDDFYSLLCKVCFISNKYTFLRDGIDNM